MTKQKEISQDFIQEKYMQLLEESYIDTQEKSSNKSKNRYILLSSLFLITFFSFYFLKSSPNNLSFASNLVKTTFNTKEVLIENNSGVFFKIPSNKSKNWVTDNGISVNINTSEIKINGTTNINNTPKFIIHTPTDKTYKIELPDLSKIQVNKNSSLQVNLFVNEEIPNIELKGEAFFNIAKQTSKPFQILANNMNIEVVGTEFNISNYQDNNFTQLSLVEGVVKIKNNTELTVIQAGEQATLNNHSSKLVIDNRDFSEALAWLHNNIYFENKPLFEISKIIENWYNVKFKFNNSTLKNIHFTGALEKEKGLTHFLQLLKYTENVKYKINKKTIILNYK